MRYSQTLRIHFLIDTTIIIALTDKVQYQLLSSSEHRIYSDKRRPRCTTHKSDDNTSLEIKMDSKLRRNKTMSLHLEKSNQCSNDALEENESSSAHSDDDLQHLLHVADSLPPRVWIAVLIAIFERFTYEGTQSIFRTQIAKFST